MPWNSFHIGKYSSALHLTAADHHPSHSTGKESMDRVSFTQPDTGHLGCFQYVSHYKKPRDGHDGTSVLAICPAAVFRSISAGWSPRTLPTASKRTALPHCNGGSSFSGNPGLLPKGPGQQNYTHKETPSPREVLGERQRGALAPSPYLKLWLVVPMTVCSASCWSLGA